MQSVYWMYLCIYMYIQQIGLQDGEVDSFQLLPVEEVVQLIAETDEFKESCNLVMLDFLVRHGYVQPDQPGYLQLLAGLRNGDCS